MPNNITNLITFGTDGASLSAFRIMLYAMKADGEPLGSFDFNKLIPMPESLNIEQGSRTERGLEMYREFVREQSAILDAELSPVQREDALAGMERAWYPRRLDDPETWRLGEQAYDNLQKYGHASWYSWCIQNWGTKWNAYQSCPLRDGGDTMRFLTAWSAVPKLMRKLSEKYPEQRITYRWADEDIGYNVGEIVLKGGNIIEDRTPVPGSREAYEMAAEIMGVDLTAVQPAKKSKSKRRDVPR